MSRPPPRPAAMVRHPDTKNPACGFSLLGAFFEARPSGAAWRPHNRLLAVADLHLGKAERLARRGGPLLPPYETEETLVRLAAEIDTLDPAIVLCLGDSFDDGEAARNLGEGHRLALSRMMAGRRWIWIAGNHDPAPPLDLAGEHRSEWRMIADAAASPPRPLGPFDDAPLHDLEPNEIVFRHAGRPDAPPGEISGHLHPKATLFARGRRLSRPCFLIDWRRAILPAFGAYTGGLDAADPVFDAYFTADADALLIGPVVRALPRRLLVAPHAPPT